MDNGNYIPQYVNMGTCVIYVTCKFQIGGLTQSILYSGCKHRFIPDRAVEAVVSIHFSLNSYFRTHFFVVEVGQIR